MIGSWTNAFVYSWYVMVPLLFCSIASLAVILERIISLRPDSVIKPALARAIHELGYGGKTTLIEQESADEDTALSRLVRACLMYTSWPKDENAEAVQAYARREIVRLERGLVFLEVATGLGPLLGLMGTILGLIRIFSSAGHADELSTQSAQIAAGIAEAMYCNRRRPHRRHPQRSSPTACSRATSRRSPSTSRRSAPSCSASSTPSPTLPVTAAESYGMQFPRKPRRSPVLNIIPLDRRARRAAHLLHRHHGVQENREQLPHHHPEVRQGRGRARRRSHHDLRDKDSKIYLGDQLVDPDLLGDMLKQKVAADPNFKVALKAGHTDAPFGAITKVMAAARNAGIPDLPTYASPGDSSTPTDSGTPAPAPANP